MQKGYLWQGQLRIVAELDASGQVTARFIYGTKVNVPEYMIKGGVTYRLITDQLGSVRLVVNASTGAVVQRIDYDEFGVVTNDTYPGFTPFGFAGGLYDNDTRLVRFGARDYDAETGRWTGKDTVLFEGGEENLYGYSIQDPVNKQDPEGLEVPDWVLTMPLWDGPEIGPADIIAGAIALICLALDSEPWYLDLVNKHKRGKGERKWEKGRGDGPEWSEDLEKVKDKANDRNLPPETRQRYKKAWKIRKNK